jgi:2-phosphosulfolactate phosphatase
VPFDVALSPADLARQQLAGRTVFVVDILRATTTICAALHHGARAVVPCATPEEAQEKALGIPGAVLAGERDCARIPGFDLGNSPKEMRPRRVQDRVVVLCTTNGTAALVASASAAQCYVLAAANFSVTVARARALLERADDLLVVCAGREGGFGLDDAYTAGRFLRAVLAGRVRGRGLSDAALAAVQLARHHGNRWDRLLRQSGAGRRLTGLGFGEDVRLAARQDEFPVLAVMRDGRIVPAT